MAVGAALASAATFGLSTSLQHHVSSSTLVRGPHRLLLHLVRSPRWVAGMSLSVGAFALHAVALGHGALVLVQPAIVTGVVFAVLIRAALDRRTPSRAELGWAVVTWSGLAAFLVGAGTSKAAGSAPVHAGPAVAVVLALAALGALRAGRRPDGSVGKGLWLGVVSGLLFGAVAVLLKLTIDALPGGLLPLATSWAPWVMVACGVGAVLVNQRAYQTTRLSVSMPILNIVDVIVALVLAVVVFGETVSLAPPTLAAQGLGLVLMALGVVRLARLEEADDEAEPRVHVAFM